MIKLNEVDGKEQVDLLNQYSEEYVFDAIDLSREFSLEAYRLSYQLEYLPGRGKALLNRGKIAFLTGNLSQSVELLDSALLAARTLGEVDWEGDVYRWLARAYEAMDELAQSIACYQSYFDLYESRNDKANMALALNWQGDLLLRLDRISEAKGNYQQAYQYFTELKNQYGRFVTMINLARLELNDGSHDRAGLYLNQVDQMVGGIDDAELLLAYFQIKAAYFQKNKPDSALYYLQLALRKTDRSNESITKLTILKEISDLYATMRKYEQADRFNQEYSRLHDSLYQVSGILGSDSSRDLVSGIDDHSTNMDDQAVPGDVKKETFLILLLPGAVFLVFSISLFVIYLYRLRKGSIFSGINFFRDREKISGLSDPDNTTSQKFTKNMSPEVSDGANSSGEPLREEEYPSEGKVHTREQTDQISFSQEIKSESNLSPGKDIRNASITESPANFILILDEKLIVKFVNESMGELLQYGMEEWKGMSIDLLMKDDESENEIIFNKITEILESGKENGPKVLIPVIFKNKSGASCYLHGFLSIYQQGTQLLILFQFLSRPQGDYQKKEIPGHIHFTPKDLKDFYEAQGVKKKEYLIFIFNQYLSKVYHSLIGTSGWTKFKRGGFSLQDIPLEGREEVVQIFKIYEPLKHLFLEETNERIRFHEEIKNDEIPAQKKEWIGIVIYILLKNAIQSIRESGDIYFISLIRRNQYQLKFVDTGEGMDPDLMEKAFNPFFSNRSGNENYGLGLTVAREIMRRHDGRIKIRSKYGKGTEVTLEFPIKIHENNPRYIYGNKINGDIS